MLWILLGIISSYLAGSIPTAYIFGRALKGVDIRKFGSGNVGATNALRLLGRRAGAAVLILDIFKGVLAVFVLGNLFGPGNRLISDELFRIIMGVACICGHNWTVFLRFKGGKGVATTFGVLIGLSMKISGFGVVLGLLILTWLITFSISRIVSVSSVVSAVSLPVYAIIFRQSAVVVFLAFLLFFFIILRHKSNLKRLFQGKEPRL